MSLATPVWNPPPDPLSLSPQTVHIWRAHLQGSTQDIPILSQWLVEEEQQRAHRYHFVRDRHRFIRARGILRLLLGRYLNLHPRDLRFQYGCWGKPFLCPLSHPSCLGFNLSHSEDLVLLAFTPTSTLGIDVEFIRPIRDLESLSQRFFSPQEHQLLLAQAPDLRLPFFFRLWTAKEACLKALGDGLGQLETVECVLNQTGEIQLHRASPAPESWNMQQWIPLSGYLASLATPVSLGTHYFFDLNLDFDLLSRLCLETQS